MTPFNKLFDEHHVEHIVWAGLYFVPIPIMLYLMSNVLITKRNICQDTTTIGNITFATIILISIVSGSIGNFTGSVEKLTSRGGLLTSLFTIFLISTALIYANRGGVFRITIACIFISLVGISSGSKSFIVFPLLSIWITSRIHKPNVKWFKEIIFLTALLILLFPVLIVSVIGRHAEYFDLIEYLLRSPEVLVSLVQRFYGIESVALVIQERATLNTLFGDLSSYQNLAYGFVPSFIWPEKPVISFGIFLSQTLYEPIFLGRTVATSATLLGEGIVNGTVIFGYVNFMFCGFVFISIIRLCILLNFPTTIILYFLLSFANFLEGEIVGNTIRMIAFFCVLVAVKSALVVLRECKHFLFFCNKMS